MSQPQSPTTEHLSSPLDVLDDNPEQRSAISNTARQERLAALERRQNRSTTDPHDDAAVQQDPQPFDANHDKRTEFRRLVDPGIMRPNSKEIALRSLRVNYIFTKNPFVSPASRLRLKENTTVFFFWGGVARCPLCRRCLRSQRTCFESLTIPSFVSSSRRIRSSSGIS
jgi:hypothetical protein